MTNAKSEFESTHNFFGERDYNWFKYFVCGKWILC